MSFEELRRRGACELFMSHLPGTATTGKLTALVQ
jgi:hypothetical protein